MNWKLKVLIVALAGIILGLLLVLIFVPSARGPVVPPANTSSTIGVAQTATSTDGHLVVSAPVEHQTIASPAHVTGTVAGGGWFFEASFPVKVIDADGTVLGQGQARAQGDWMSTGTVPFAAAISFVKPHSATGTVVFSKDNPSGLPQNAESLAITIVFATSTSGAPGLIVPTSTPKPVPTSTVQVFKDDSGVRGTVTLGPTCPVETIPPSPQCASKPYVTQIVVYQKNSLAVFATTNTDGYGDYVVALPAGDYLLVPKGGDPLPRCASAQIIVTARTFITESLTCDTGIR